MAIRDRLRAVKHLQNKNYICVLENPRLPVNLASAIRNVSAFGVEKIYIIGGSGKITGMTDNYKDNEDLRKMSVGANKWVFIKYFETTKECIEHLQKNNFKSIVTSSHQKDQKNVYLYEGGFTQKKLAVWFGNESKGVSDEAVQAAEACVEIPMGGIVESLNLGTSTGIVLSYISYQRIKFVYENEKVKFKPKGSGQAKMGSWHDFLSRTKVD